MGKTAAWPLSLVYAALIVYASLYPFEGWRVQGLAPWAFVTAPWPRYWTGFDVTSNLLGYAPFGFLWALALHRSGGRWPVLGALLAATVLTLCMESMQTLLPRRVPSNVDALLNMGGALLGAWLARWLERAGWLSRWSRWRDRWFIEDARGILVLLWLWPLALLFPAPVVFGLGQVLERAGSALADQLLETPLIDWMPLREIELQPMLPFNEVVCVGLGLLVPVLLAYGVIRQWGQRLAMAVMAALLGVGAALLSAILTYGPAHAWGWFSREVGLGLSWACVAALAALGLPRRASLVLALVALVWQLTLLNNASADAYFAQTLQTWEQGRFIRFHGLIQWLGWLWPYLVLMNLLLRLSQGPRPRR